MACVIWATRGIAPEGCRYMERAKQTSESIELGIVLALAGGFMDAYSYVARDGVFANAQTGNILLTGVHISEGDYALALRFLAPVLCFSLGIMLSDLVHERFSNRIHWRQVTVLVEALILLGVSFVSGDLNILANSLTSLACGMQVESFRKIHGHGIATTMCIGNLRSGMDALVAFGHTHDKNALWKSLQYFAIIFIFALGAGIGTQCVGIFGERTIWLSCTLLLVSLCFMFIKEDLPEIEEELKK